MIGPALDRRVLLRGDRDDPAVPGPHLGHVAQDLFVGAVARAEKDHRHVLIDESDRAVLHLGGRVALRMNVGDLLELEGTLQRHREIEAPAQGNRRTPRPANDATMASVASVDPSDTTRMSIRPAG